MTSIGWKAIQLRKVTRFLKPQPGLLGITRENYSVEKLTIAIFVTEAFLIKIAKTSRDN
jgi:hypothetical protein